MKYRKFGKLDWKVSTLGFGTMRLPIIDGDTGRIDEPESIKMIRYAIDHGVNYVDTGYGYHEGSSEILVGKALQEGYREKTRLATKLPPWLVDSHEDMTKCLAEQLEKLQTDYINFYLLHGLTKESWQKLKDLKVFDWLEWIKGEGKIRDIGFSFHDDFSVFKDIIDSYDGWTFCQIMYNYMDIDYQAGTKGLKYAASKGLAVVVMEPLAGGNLASRPHPDVQAIWDETRLERSPADLALQWVWNQPEVSVILSGMSTMEQVIENVESADNSGINTLTKLDLDVVSRIREEYSKLGKVRCTNCRYCVPCPQGVAIPEIFVLYNEYSLKDGDRQIIDKYMETIPPENRATLCIRCGQCEDLCPQQIPIRNILGGVLTVFEKAIERRNETLRSRFKKMD